MKITKLPSQYSMLGHHPPAKRKRVDDGSLILVVDPSIPSSTIKKRGQSWTPLIKPSGSGHDLNCFAEVGVSSFGYCVYNVSRECCSNRKGRCPSLSEPSLLTIAITNKFSCRLVYD